MPDGSAAQEFDGDLSDVDEVWLGSESVAGEEFVEALNTVEWMQDWLRDFKAELDEMNVGLDREDAIRLVYARRSQFNLKQVRSAFEVVDAIVDEDPADIAPRLLADQTSELTIEEAAEVWDEIVALAEKYGTEDDDT